MKQMHVKKGEGMTFKGTWRFTIRDAVTGAIKRVQVYENLIPTAGRALFASAIAGAVAAETDLEANYTSLGTGTTAPANGNTTLQTETYRKAIASTSTSDNIVYMTANYSATEVTGTFREAGIHMGGTASANTGTLLSRVAINVTKTNAETLTIDYTLTIS